MDNPSVQHAIIEIAIPDMSMLPDFIDDSVIPNTLDVFRHALETYASETNKTASVFRTFSPADVNFRPHPRSATVLEIMKHELISERRFFADFLGVPEPLAADVLAGNETPESLAARLVELALPRLSFLAERDQAWWLERRPFFEVERERIWTFWRRILHSAHHRTQLTVYLRLLDRPVPSIYGPTADFSWAGASPTLPT